jgi:hypothetical protein
MDSTSTPRASPVAPVRPGRRAHMIHVHQPQGSALCGQACLATVAGLTLDEACYLVGHRAQTGPWEIAAALGALGFELWPRLRGGAAPPPDVTGLLDLRGGSGGHVVVLDGTGRVLDPAQAEPVALAAFLDGGALRPHAVLELRGRLAGSDRPDGGHVCRSGPCCR